MKQKPGIFKQHRIGTAATAAIMRNFSYEENAHAILFESCCDDGDQI